MTKPRSLMRAGVAAFAIVSVTAACGGMRALVASNPVDVAAPAKSVYQPLAVGDTWKYVCNHEFSIENAVVGTVRIGKKQTYAFSIQIPSSPSKSVKVVQLLANDSTGITRIYGYRIYGKVHAVTPTEIVVPSPVLHRHYDYPAAHGGTITRVFVGFENTNPTPLGTFRVAPYFESNATHNYGYTLGRGIMEEDHGPNYRYDCLIEKVVLK